MIEGNIDVLPAWFAADSLAVSPDGKTIQRQGTDSGLPPKTMTVSFAKN
jgi:hypothetical protein